MILPSQNKHKSRIIFLFSLAVIITGFFYWMIKGFLLAIFIAAVMAALLHPLYQRVVTWCKGREGLASAVTVLLSLVLVIIPCLFFLGIVVNEAAEMAASAKTWVVDHNQTPTDIPAQLADNEVYKKLLPYQDEIIEKSNALAAKVGAWLAHGLAAGVQGMAHLVLSLFIMLYAMSYFLTDGQSILNAVLKYIPLNNNDQSRLLGTFVSVTRATIKGKIVVGVAQGGLAGLSFWLAGIDGVFFWSAVMAVLSIIPALGTAIIWVPAVIYLAINGQVGAAIGVGLWCALVVGTIDNILTPLLIGKDTEMPDLLVLLTTLGGLTVFGIAGVVIGPIIGSLFIAVWSLWGQAMDDGGDLENEQCAS